MLWPVKAPGDAGGELLRSPAPLPGPPLRSQSSQMGTACGSHLSVHMAPRLALAQQSTQVCRLLTCCFKVLPHRTVASHISRWLWLHTCMQLAGSRQLQPVAHPTSQRCGKVYLTISPPVHKWPAHVYCSQARQKHAGGARRPHQRRRSAGWAPALAGCHGHLRWLGLQRLLPQRRGADGVGQRADGN